MSQADVIGLVTLLSNGQADQTVIPSIYTEIVDSWSARPILTQATLLTVTANTELTLPVQVRDVIGIIWDDREIGKLSLRELESLNPQWRSIRGKPNSFTDEAETAKVLAFYPSPFVPSNPDTGGMTGEDLGQDYPTYSVVLINTEGRQDVMSYLELPLALLIIEREFSRESDHRKVEFAQMAGDFGRFLLEMVL